MNNLLFGGLLLVLCACEALGAGKGLATQDEWNECKTAGKWKSRSKDKNIDDIAWFNQCIVKVYGFVKDPKKDEWKSMPSFRGQGIGDAFFNLAAEKSEAFFKRNNDWGATMKTYKDAKGKCPDLLTITAARYVFVTSVLYEESERKLQPCSQEGPKIVVPKTGSCFPAPYGSATCSSDYDVGLVGPDSGVLTGNFNDFFTREFKKPSEQVFDTNVYAFTLEFAMPSRFVSLPKDFASKVTAMNAMPKYKIQELVSALYKMYKYDEGYYKELLDASTKTLKDGPGKQTDWLKLFKGWSNQIKQWDDFKATQDRDKKTDFRADHNAVYQDLVKDVSGPGELLAGYMAQVGFALLYAAEAYHTRGAIRHVVGITQMKDKEIERNTGPIDYWVSMIENWGDSNKEVGHCSAKTMEKCMLKMSKYLWRTYNAMLALDQNSKIPKSKTDPAVSDLDSTTNNWLKNYKKAGKTELDSAALNPFKTKVSAYCNYNKSKPRCKGCGTLDDCLNSIQEMVKDYHYKMLTLLNSNKL